MPIINGNCLHKKSKIKAEINAEVYAKIQQYCEWADIQDLGFFIEEAACFVFAKDRDWKQHQRLQKKLAAAKS